MMKKLLLFLLSTVAAASLIANVLMYKRYSSQRTLVQVGGETITRKDYQDAVDYKYGYGKQAMQKLVFGKAIMQAARKANVVPSDADVTERLNDLRQARAQEIQKAESDPNLLAELRRSIAADLAFENLRIRNVAVTDQEVTDFYNKNKAGLTTPTQATGLIVLAKNAVDASTAAELMRQQIKPEVIAQQPRLGVVGVRGFNPNLGELSPASTRKLSQAVSRVKPGGVVTVPVQHQNQPLFIVFRADRKSAPALQPLAAVKDKIARGLKLAKAPSEMETLAKIYKESNVVFETDNYKSYFSDLEVAQNTP